MIADMVRLSQVVQEPAEHGQRRLDARHKDHGGDDEGLVAGFAIGGEAGSLEDIARLRPARN